MNIDKTMHEWVDWILRNLSVEISHAIEEESPLSVRISNKCLSCVFCSPTRKPRGAAVFSNLNEASILEMSSIYDLAATAAKWLVRPAAQAAKYTRRLVLVQEDGNELS